MKVKLIWPTVIFFIDLKLLDLLPKSLLVYYTLSQASSYFFLKKSFSFLIAILISTLKNIFQSDLSHFSKIFQSYLRVN